MKTQAMLRALANGINPETGELLGTASMTGSPEAIRLLFALAEEFQVEPERQKKVKLSPEERQQKNIAEGRPAKSHFPWAEEEKQRLQEIYAEGGTLEALSSEFERTTWAIAVQLQKMGLITEQQAARYV